MSPEGAVVWLRKVQESLDEKSETSKIIAINMGIKAIKESCYFKRQTGDSLEKWLEENKNS